MKEQQTSLGRIIARGAGWAFREYFGISAVGETLKGDPTRPALEPHEIALAKAHLALIRNPRKQKIIKFPSSR